MSKRKLHPPARALWLALFLSLTFTIIPSSSIAGVDIGEPVMDEADDQENQRDEVETSTHAASSSFGYYDKLGWHEVPNETEPEPRNNRKNSRKSNRKGKIIKHHTVAYSDDRTNDYPLITPKSRYPFEEIPSPLPTRIGLVSYEVKDRSLVITYSEETSVGSKDAFFARVSISKDDGDTWMPINEPAKVEERILESQEGYTVKQTEYFFPFDELPIATRGFGEVELLIKIDLAEGYYASGTGGIQIGSLEGLDSVIIIRVEVPGFKLMVDRNGTPFLHCNFYLLFFVIGRAMWEKFRRTRCFSFLVSTKKKYDDIVRLIAEGRLNRALRELYREALSWDDDIGKEVCLLRARFTTVTADLDRGVIERSHFYLEKNRISAAVLELVFKLQQR